MRRMLAALPLPKDAHSPDVATVAPTDAAELKPLQALKGHSGARVILCLRGQRSVVRKTAASPTQNTRLQKQAEKQRLLFALAMPFPRVLAEGIDAEGCAFVEMDYVPARTVASVIGSSTPFDQGLVFAAVERALALFRLTEGSPIAPEIFHRKIAETATQAATDASLASQIGSMSQALMSCDWSGIPSSACHGDMTLENLLVGQGRGLVFIDCDEPFASSHWLDIAKLCQDIDGHWCARHLYLASQPGPALINAAERLRRLVPDLRELAARAAPGFEARRPQLTALNLFRTLPYTKDKQQAGFVLTRMRGLLASPRE